MVAQDERPFLDAILATPDDDTPRLVFADWLDERGQNDDAARAALIRAQCQLEHLAPGSAARRVLERAAKAILKEHGERWAQELAGAKICRSWTFRRGFLDGVSMSATTFAQKAERLFEIAPTVRTATFPDASNEVTRLARCPYLARLASVDIRDMCSCGYCRIENDLRALFGSKHTQSLTALNIASDRMDATGAKSLAASAALARLTVLDVSDNPLGATGVLALAKSKHLGNLKSLHLARTELGSAGAEALAKVKNLPALEHLSLCGNALTADAVRALVAAPVFTQVKSLDLSQNPLRAPGAKLLAAVPAGAKLEHLDVRKCQIPEGTIRTLKKRFGKGVKL
ncbi:Leucine Rich repeats (2 copies) [Gemmata sp. SH-PL17]|uniref:TIGR02996 domain-containing protein n=1 Tax=Gemmata sp. SH-PL17 TaxID=1630693 RepID=UPI00078C36EC|nr:TIGR02996 domain-containing protein [Gemmata sp. SH-PL17]AMV28215.1 Leucine Rich repeats (2 copies) [Gemmata sp. SH-PL17]